MGQKKLIRFREIDSFSNVLQRPLNMPGKWKAFFKNNNPITLELACGKAEYTLGLAQINLNRNFIGVDIKGNRLWVGAKKCLDDNITNAAFLRIQIDKITEYFEPCEVDEIWITFPDPQLRKSKAPKRLTHPKFLRWYQQIQKPGGLIHLKTDSPDLYNFTKSVIFYYGLNVLSDISDVHKIEQPSPELMISTHYQNLDIAKSKRIFYLCFTLPAVISEDDKMFIELLNKEELNFNEQRVN